LGSNVDISEIAIVAGKEIKIGSNVRMSETVLVTNSKVLFGSTNDIGTANFCESGHYSVYVMSGDNIEYGSQSLFQGVRMGAVGEVKLGSELRAVQGVYAESLGNIDYGSADTYGGCPQGLRNQLFEKFDRFAYALVY